MTEMVIMPTDERIPPMGSEAADTHFNETAAYDPKLNTRDLSHNNNKQCIPHYEHWKDSLPDLLDDTEGYKLFYEFLEQDKSITLFECWYCCNQYRNLPPTRTSAKDIYHRFVKKKDPHIPISDQARNNLVLRIKANDITEKIYEEIEKEVYTNLRDICYPKFLKSDCFNQYCESSGQMRYAEYNTDYGKPSTKYSGVLDHIGKHDQYQPQSRSDYERQYECARHPHHDRVHGPSSNYDDHHSMPSDYDRSSITDSKTSMGSSSRHGRPSRGHNRDYDGPMDVNNFKPRTQRINQDRMKPMKPTDFAALLTQKLEKVLIDRTRDGHDNSSHHSHGDSMDLSSMKHHLPGGHNSRVPPHHQPHIHDFDGQSESDAQSWVLSDRPSVAGQSSHSGSHSGILMKNKAKELRDKIHHHIRSDLKECRCAECRLTPSVHSGGRHEHDSHARHGGSEHGFYPHSSNSNSYNYSNDTIQDRYNTMSSSSHQRGSSRTRETHPHPDAAPPLDTSKIYSWMEKNERYQHQKSYPDPSPSPSLRRKKAPIQYNTSRSQNSQQPIAQDTGMPLLPQPDPDNVLQEVKRKLEEPSRSQQNHHRSSRQQQQYHTPHYEGGYHPHHDNQSMASAPWSMSDNSSIISYNPSQVSTVPSSASRLWNAQGYYKDAGSEVRDDRCTPSEVHSQAASKHSGPRSVTRSDHMSAARSDHHSDVRSQSTGISYGSDGSKGRSSSSKNKTVITYYYGSEPIPYRISVPTTEVTLSQFKLETKRGNYRFFFKTVSSVDGEVVWEEFKNDDDVLPKFNDKIVGKVDKI
ncbi:axin-1-like [Clytia hemisphaerica]|uniref:Axin-1 n=1 Tax=Clytia hemisphaerica TaxID=252671 RepID=A0A7M5WXV7_9CNID